MSRIIITNLLGLMLVFGGSASAAAPVRMAYLQNDIHHLAFWIALENGFFNEQGTHVDVAGVFRAGPEIMTAFAAGALDMAYVGEAPATTAVANKTARVVVVSQVNTEGSALVIPPDHPEIQQISDLAGKTVAVPGHSTVQDFLFKKAMKRQGLDHRQVNVMVLKPPEMIGALRTGQIDAFIAWEPYPSMAGTLKVGKNLATSRDMWPGHPCCVLVADRKFLENHSEKVEAVVRAHVQATDFIHENPEASAAIGVKYTGMDMETVRQAMQTVDYTYHLSIGGETAYVQFLSELGYIRVADPNAFVGRFIDQNILRKILHP